VDEETIGVVGLFTDQLTLFPISSTHDWNVSGEELTGLDADIGKAYNAMVVQIGAGMGDFVKAAVLARGIRGILYSAPVPPDLTNAPVTEGWAAANSWGQNPVTVNNQQAFPLIGWIEVQWRRSPGSIGAHVEPGAWQIIERHLETMRIHPSLHGESDVMVRAREASALFTELGPRSIVNVGGEWRYRIQGARGKPPEIGRLWLRTNGTLIQGVLETAERRQDGLSGSLTKGEGDGALQLVRTIKAGAEQRIRLVQKGSAYAGMIEGTHQQVELLRP
jgi:hypothetical protein